MKAKDCKVSAVIHNEMADITIECTGVPNAGESLSECAKRLAIETLSAVRDVIVDINTKKET